jgi:dTDP-4-amino-4,6-dideoxygalactose transaminase
MNIPILDLTPEIDLLWGELNAAFERVMRSGQFIMGAEVTAFETEIAAYLGVKHAVGVNSGTDALLIALRALGVQPGDEVITTPFSFIATSEPAEALGAKAVFVDIDPRTFNLDPAQVEAAITPRTRAIIPVHLYGHAADMDAISAIAARHRLCVLEDVAQAFGGRYRGRRLGSLGDAGALSFFPSKNLGAFGDAGMIVTDRDDVAETAKMLRAHGSRKKYYNETIGYNSRLDALQAALLRVKLPHLDAFCDGRRAAAARYRALLAGIDGLTLPFEADYAHHVYHQYTVRIADGRRDAVQRQLADAGIGTMVYYPVPLHRLPIYSGRAEHFPEAERATEDVLSLPMSPHISAQTQAQVADALRTALK